MTHHFPQFIIHLLKLVIGNNCSLHGCKLHVMDETLFTLIENARDCFLAVKFHPPLLIV